MNIRRRSLTDSLQLLVDTICNLFGSIIIISLLMALLSKDTPTDATTSERAQNWKKQVQQTQSELDEARRLQTTIASNPGDKQRLTLAGEINQLKNLTSSNLALIQSNTTRLPITSLPSVSIEDMLARKSTLESELASATNQLNQSKLGNTRQLRLPRERATGKKTYYFICRFGKIYPVHLMIEGRRERNTQTIDWRETPDGEIATPRREVGFDPVTGLQMFARLFVEIPPQTYSIHFLVYNDSFPAFLAARQIPLARNFDTGWEFFIEDRPIVFSSRGESPPAL
jgi:hypothetical protein